MATYRKPLKDIDGNFIIPAMTGDQTEWIQTGDIADGAVTSEKLDYTTKGATLIPANSDLNTVDFLTPGKYYNPSDTQIATLSNCPTSYAFSMWVINPLGERSDPTATSLFLYFIRVIVTYRSEIYIQRIWNSGTTTYNFGPWIPLASNRSNPASYSVNTTYVNNAGSSTNFFRMGSLVVVNINLNIKAGTVPSGTALITGLPPCNMGGRSSSSMVGTNGSGVRLQILEGGTSIIADGAFTATAQWYNGQITYMSY